MSSDFPTLFLLHQYYFLVFSVPLDGDVSGHNESSKDDNRSNRTKAKTFSALLMMGVSVTTHAIFVFLARVGMSFANIILKLIIKLQKE